MSITDNQVTKLAQSIFRSQTEAETGRVTYLRTVLMAAQELLQKGESAAAQLEALSTVHNRFYPLVTAAASEFVPRTMKDRGTEIQRRCNFARTALLALRQHVRAGGDLAKLKESVTRGQLLKPPARVTPASSKRLVKRASREAARVANTFAALAELDKDVAAQEIQLLMDKLAEQLAVLGGKTMFVPSDTHVIRQRARPS